MLSNPTSNRISTASKLKSENLSTAVLTWLKNEILQGNFGLGDELPSELELCEMLGVGKSSVREALKTLQMIGVVEIRQGKRSRICPCLSGDVLMPLIFRLMLQSTSYDEMYNFRIVFESAVMKYLINNITDDDILKLSDELDRYHQLCELGTATVEEEFVFHKLLLECCKNSFILQIGMLLLDLFERPLSQLESHDCYRVLSEHTAILDALRSQDNDAMEKAIDLNFVFYREIMSQANRKEPPNP